VGSCHSGLHSSYHGVKLPRHCWVTSVCVVCCGVCVQLSPQIRKVEQQQKKIKSQADQIHSLNEQLGVLQAERQQAQKKFNHQLEVGGAGWMGLVRRTPSSQSTVHAPG